MTKQQSTFNIGDKVLRKSDTAFVLIGEVVRKEGSKLRIAWPDERRISGSGLYHTCVKPGSLVLATGEAIKKRNVKWYQNHIAHEEALEQAERWYCSSCKHTLDARWSNNGTLCHYCQVPVEKRVYVSRKLPGYRQALEQLLKDQKA